MGSNPDGPPTWAVDIAQAEIDELTQLWLDAAARGWSLSVGRYSQAWSIGDASRDVRASYEPPNEICIGRVDAHDRERTLMLTGVASHAAAVAALRAFYGWPRGEVPPPPPRPPAVSPARCAGPMRDAA